MALNESPGESRATNNLALVLGHAGKSEESLALFRQVSGEAPAWVNLGYVHVSLGEGEKAAECFAKALSIDDRLKRRPTLWARLPSCSNRLSSAPHGSSTLPRPKQPVQKRRLEILQTASFRLSVRHLKEIQATTAQPSIWLMGPRVLGLQFRQLMQRTHRQ